MTVLVLALHAHLPDVRDRAVEAPWTEDWFFEALRDVYLPLWRLGDGWMRDGLPVSMVLSLSPPLLALLQDRRLGHVFVERTEAGIRLAEHLGHAGLGARWRQALQTYEAVQGDLVRACVDLFDAGVYEPFTSAATHGLLPLLHSVDARLARAQIRVGLREFEGRTGRRPVGLWLPECSFDPALAAELGRARVPSFFVEAHGAEGARMGTAAPIQCPEGPVAFPRDPSSALQVWSPDGGFPGHPAYRDFHSDGSDRVDRSLRRRFGLPGDDRPLGLKFWAVTGRTEKAPYEPEVAHRQVVRDARRFVQDRLHMGRAHSEATGWPLVVGAPFDAELFGHWWSEGAAWLDQVVRESVAGGLRVQGPGAVIRSGLPMEVRRPRVSTWGQGGHLQTWLGRSNAWVQDEVARIGRAMIRAAADADGADGERLDAMAESTLRVQASDWPFLMGGGAFAEHAAQRVRREAERFERLRRGEPPFDRSALTTVSWRDFL